MRKIARIAYSSNDWQKPTGKAGEYEAANTYSHTHRFGHEEWLFRSEWLIDGWRYAFVQGVNKSRTSLLKAGQPFDLTLFTIQPDKRRRYVAMISEVECLDDRQAAEAVDVFKQLGWYESMLAEIKAVGGDASGLGNSKFASSVVNVRYRLDNLNRFGPKAYATPGDPILTLNRYQLVDLDKYQATNESAAHVKRKGSIVPPATKSFMRRATAAVECTPEHARMQELLLKELKQEYPKAKVECESDYIDVSVTTKQEIILFEIKSDLEPRTVIRQALGQILEYAYHPNRCYPLPVSLVIVGRRPVAPQDEVYLMRLINKFALPLSYRVVEL